MHLGSTRCVGFGAGVQGTIVAVAGCVVRDITRTLVETQVNDEIGLGITRAAQHQNK